MFDGAGYRAALEASSRNASFEAQAEAGADRLLTQGHWSEWNLADDALSQSVDAARRDCEDSPEATLVLAMQSRWITKTEGLYRTIDVLSGVPEPVALVLSTR